MLELLVLLAAPAAAADCPQKAELGELRRILDAATESYTLGDRPSLEAAARDAERLLPCLANPLAPADAALLHLVEGLFAWDPDKPEQADPYLRASHALDPDASLSAWGLGAEDPVARRWAGLPPDAGGLRLRLPPPATGRLAVDGQVDPHHPTGDPYVLQLLRGSTVLTGGYVHPGERPAYYPRLRPRLALAGAGLGVLAMGLLVGGELTALTVENRRDGAEGDTSLETLRTLNNTLLISGLVAGAGSLGAFGSLVAVSF